jgi:hypothetical protein
MGRPGPPITLRIVYLKEKEPNMAHAKMRLPKEVVD